MLFSGHPSACRHGDHTSSWRQPWAAMGSRAQPSSGASLAMALPLSPISQSICGMRSVAVMVCTLERGNEKREGGGREERRKQRQHCYLFQKTADTGAGQNEGLGLWFASTSVFNLGKESTAWKENSTACPSSQTLSPIFQFGALGPSPAWSQRGQSPSPSPRHPSFPGQQEQHLSLICSCLISSQQMLQEDLSSQPSQAAVSARNGGREKGQKKEWNSAVKIQEFCTAQMGAVSAAPAFQGWEHNSAGAPALLLELS